MEMIEIVQVIGLFLGFGGWIVTMVSLQDQYWKESTTEGSVITTSTIYENLWMSCASDSTGIYNCRDFPSLFALPGYIQASRALMIAAIVFGTFGLVASLAGIQCTKIGGDNYALKGRIAAIGGVFFILQGLCTMIAISWYAANITQQFFDEFYPGTKYEIGEGLYIGWSSGVLSLCGGGCLMCSCKLDTPEEKRAYVYQPPSRGNPRSAVGSPQHAPSINYGRNAYV
ncbi:claudin-15b isoform X1 [Gadus morhua]|uniref:Claudin n=1 Tax=Gadus morhua TaxID=8049 RepID=A0A8C5AGD1_GADMO|nr:claudin-15 isoform X1 [Gadus morhua]XP_056450308.1 claudin-15-like isoform X1 [Gadus chalcogrammus]